MQFVAVKSDGTAGGVDAARAARTVDRPTHPAEYAIRGDAAEFGLATARGLDKIEPLLSRIAQDETVPTLARELFALQGRDYTRLQDELKAIDAKLLAWHRADACSRRLAQIPGVGPIGATALVMKAPVRARSPPAGILRPGSG